MASPARRFETSKSTAIRTQRLAKLDGKGELYQPCHATAGDKEVTKGHYDTVNGNELACHDSHEWILCHPEDTSGNVALCVDGYKD